MPMAAPIALGPCYTTCALHCTICLRFRLKQPPDRPALASAAACGSGTGRKSYGRGQQVQVAPCAHCGAHGTKSTHWSDSAIAGIRAFRGNLASNGQFRYIFVVLSAQSYLKLDLSHTKLICRCHIKFCISRNLHKAPRKLQIEKLM